MNKLLLLSACLLLTLGGCAEAERLARDAMSVVSTTQADWTMDATQYRGQNGSRYAFTCPANGTADTVWGTGPYTDDSSVCTAGVHAGVITFGRGGRVVVQIAPGQDRYAESSANGVRTSSYGSWSGSYLIVN
jgi:hypothetical protein